MVQVFQMVSNNFPNMLLGVAFRLEANIFQRPIRPNFTDIRPWEQSCPLDKVIKTFGV